MKKSDVRFLILTGLFTVTLCSFRRNVYTDKHMTWLEARNYCREKYIDLSSVYNGKDDMDLLKWWEGVVLRHNNIWIGLYKDASDTWKWSGGKKASFFNWSSWVNNNTSENENCVAQTLRGWHKRNCNMKLGFFCFHTSLVLVKENKTWEEAVEHCRKEDTDLAVLLTERGLGQALQTCKCAQTGRVWIGLRYLAGSWLWLNRNRLEYRPRSRKMMPECPVWGHHCGTISVTEQTWDNWDCAEKLNFICY